MTKKEFDTAKMRIRSLNSVRSLINIRIFITWLVCIGAALIVFAVYAANAGLFNSDDVVVAYEDLLVFAISEVFGFFGLKYFALFGASNILSVGSQYAGYNGLVAYLAVVLILIFLSGRARKLKHNPSNLVWFILISILDLVFVGYIALSLVLIEIGLLGVALVIFSLLSVSDFVTIITAAKAMRDAQYLNGHFENGATLSVRELKKIYNREKYEQYLEI